MVKSLGNSVKSAWVIYCSNSCCQGTPGSSGTGCRRRTTTTLARSTLPSSSWWVSTPTTWWHLRDSVTRFSTSIFCSKDSTWDPHDQAKTVSRNFSFSGRYSITTFENLVFGYSRLCGHKFIAKPFLHVYKGTRESVQYWYKKKFILNK